MFGGLCPRYCEMRGTRNSRMVEVALSFTFFALCSLCLVTNWLHAKECSNVPSERTSHSVRASGLAKRIPFSSLSSSHNQQRFAGELDGKSPALVSTLRQFLNLDNHGRLVDKAQASGSAMHTKSEEDLDDDVLLDIDDWGKVLVTVMQPLLKIARRAKPQSAHANDNLKAIQVSKLPQRQRVPANDHALFWREGSDEPVPRRTILSKKNAFTTKRSDLPDLLKDVSLHKVRLGADSPQFVAQDTNLRYLLELDVNNLVWNFRKVANLEAPGQSYGGWESPQSELRGHFIGHYLSATALMWASTHDEAILEKMNSLVRALKDCQTSIGTGYLSAFPSEFFDRFEAIQYVWAPYYTIHKIMAGLLDQYTLAGNTDALDMVVAMANYFNKRVKRVIKLLTIERHWHSLNEETGGMNDVLYRLYTVTGDVEHLKLAHLFDKPCFLGPLALQADHLSGFHSNTHIPIIVGAQMRYEVTGDTIYRRIAEYFMRVVNSSHSYATGGTSVSEFWTDPKRQGNTLRTENQESCTTYNMLKVARTLFRWTKDLMYMDYYERALVNGVFGIQRGQQPGVMIYMLPLGPGTSKAQSYHGWGNKFDSFWCCYGTGIESFAKLGDSIYFEEDSEIPGVYITQFVSSDFTWEAAGLLLHMSLSKPLSSEHPRLEVTLSFSHIGSKANEATTAAVHIRIPSWTLTEGCQAYVNGKGIEAPIPGNFLSVIRSWETGDNLLFVLPMGLRTERIQDDREKYMTMHAIMFGPFVMAGLSMGDWKLGHVGGLLEWITPVPAAYGRQLYTFTQQVATSDTPFCMALFNGSAAMRPVPLDGTNQAGFSTFRVAAPCTDIPSEFVLKKKVITLELFSEPGRYLVHNGQDNLIMFINLLRKPQQASDEPPTFSKLETSPHTSLAISDSHAEDSEFWSLPGLTGVTDTVSFEAVSKPGCFLSSKSNDSSRLGGLFLRCKISQEDETFDSTSTFLLQKGVASYHPLSFIANGEYRNFLLAPLNSLRDERYSTYFEVL